MSGRSGVADGGLPRRNIKQLAAPNKCWPCQHRQKALHEKAVRNRTNIRTGPSSQVPQMLQSLLADRFHLAFHQRPARFRHTSWWRPRTDPHCTRLQPTKARALVRDLA